jgi:hypothetical protein
VCTDFKIFKVKVLLNFLGTQGFSARREGRYSVYEEKSRGLDGTGFNMLWVERKFKQPRAPKVHQSLVGNVTRHWILR